MRSASLVIVAVALATGCANPVNDSTMMRYTREGNAATSRGDLLAAEEAYRRALINVQLGNLGPQREALALHNLGIAKLNLCKLDEAREALQRAYELRDKNPGGSPGEFAGTVFELAQLNYEQHRYPDTVSLMERGIPLAEKLGADRQAPAVYAQLLVQYADALRRVNRNADADAVRARAAALASQRGIDLQSKVHQPPFNHPPC
jgi:tetratricopeptide (TPR) repeat protein